MLSLRVILWSGVECGWLLCPAWQAMRVYGLVVVVAREHLAHLEKGVCPQRNVWVRKTLFRFVFLLQRNGTRVAVGNVKRAQLFEYFLDGVARLTVAVTGTVLFCVTDGCTRGKPSLNGPCATPHMHSVGDTKPSIKS